MKYFFIAGLEHSGTTLLAQLLASQNEVLSLGEVGQFFSRPHMEQYLANWEGFEDVTRCSCGKEWAGCEFWSALISENGKFEEQEITAAYGQLLEHLARNYKRRVVVDTSKSIAYLASLSQAWQALGYSPDDFMLIVIAKDPRGFAWSIGRKRGQQPSVLSAFRSMNWWKSIYRHFLQYHKASGMNFAFVTYEQVCADPKLFITLLGKNAGLSFCALADIVHRNSHIALGNKSFIERNRREIVYDNDWERSWPTRLAYALNFPVRRTWKQFQKSAVTPESVVDKS